MNITNHSTFLPHDDPDASLSFCRDTLGFELRNDRSRVRPRRIQAWRELNELPDRELMCDGRLLV